MKCACPQRLDRSAIVQSPGTTKDAAGHVDLSQDANWNARGTRKFRFVRHGGREGVVYRQVQAETNHVLEMADDSLTTQMIPKWRLKYGTKKLNIVAVYEHPDFPRKRLYVEVSEAV